MRIRPELLYYISLEKSIDKLHKKYAKFFLLKCLTWALTCGILKGECPAAMDLGGPVFPHHTTYGFFGHMRPYR